MREYKTEQRKALLAFFTKNSGEAFSVEQILSALDPSAQISRSSIYRNLDKMVQEGLLRKTLSADGRKALYCHADCRQHCDRIHLQCGKCGRVFHMEDPSDEKRLKSVLGKSGFRLDEHTAVLPGTCRDCDLNSDGAKHTSR